MREEELVIAYLEANDWHYDKLEPSDVQEIGGVFQVSKCSGGYKYGTCIVTPAEIMVWLHERLLKLEKANDNI
jgi:hypothetical protein